MHEKLFRDIFKINPNFLTNLKLIFIVYKELQQFHIILLSKTSTNIPLQLKICTSIKKVYKSWVGLRGKTQKSVRKIKIYI